MHVDRRLLGWGIVFLLLGGIPLAAQAGLVDRAIVAQTWRLWPLILVGVGIGLVLRDTRIAAIGGLLVAATVGLIGGGFLAAGTIDLGSVACGNGQPSGAPFQQGGSLDQTAAVDLDMHCGDLSVRAVDGSSWSATGASDTNAQPGIAATPGRLSIESRERRSFFLPGLGGGREHWDVGLPRAATLDLEATANAGSATFDLRGGRYGSVDLTVNAGSLRLDLDTATIGSLDLTLNAGDGSIVLPDGPLRGELTANASALRICAPATVGLQFRTNDNPTASFEFQGLTRDGNTWTSPNYGSAAVHINLTMTANAGSIDLNPAAGCR